MRRLPTGGSLRISYYPEKRRGVGQWYGFPVEEWVDSEALTWRQAMQLDSRHDPRTTAWRDVKRRLRPATVYGWSDQQCKAYWAEIAWLYSEMGKSSCATAFRNGLEDVVQGTGRVA